VSELKSFSRATSYNELENFLWDMEQYFSVEKISVVKQMNLTVMYLRGNVKLWWRTRIKEDFSVRCPKINETWDHLKQELKELFLSNNTSWRVWEELKRLKHEMLVSENIKSFNSLILNIENIYEEDKLFNFMSGLQPW